MFKELIESHGLKLMSEGDDFVELPDSSQISLEDGHFVKYFVYPDGYPANSPDFDNFDDALNFKFPAAHRDL